MVIERSAEAEAFLAAVDRASPAAVSACEGWTTHEVAAHVTGIAVEVIRHLDPYLQGDPVPKTRSFEEREAPLRQLDHSTLLARLDEQEGQMRSVVGDVLEREPDAVVPWTGRQMAVGKFVPHLRNEHALHHWDIAGDDAPGADLLGQYALVDHSVDELGRILLVRGRTHDPSPNANLAVRLHSPGQTDLRVVVSNGTAGLVWATDPGDEPGIEVDAGARHLLIWGRRPDTRGRIRSDLEPEMLGRLQTLFSGY